MVGDGGIAGQFQQKNDMEPPDSHAAIEHTSGHMYKYAPCTILVPYCTVYAPCHQGLDTFQCITSTITAHLQTPDCDQSLS